jgi:cytochrome c553
VIIHSLVKSVVAAVLVTAVATPALAQTGSAQAGKGKIAICLACHGEGGNDSKLPNVPKLGGQGEHYLLKQLHDIKAGERAVPLMTGMLASLNEQDLADIAAWYASQSAPLGAVDPALHKKGEVLFRAGNASIGVAACAACHAVDGGGLDTAGFPALSGQDPAYTELQLKAFRAGERSNDQAEVMRSIAARLNDSEIAALASFVFGIRR